MLELSLIFFITTLSPPTDVRVCDAPNDAGGAVIIMWKLSSDDQDLSAYRIERAESGKEFIDIGFVPRGINRYIDSKTDDRLQYVYRIVALKDTARAVSEISNPIQSKGQWFHTGRVNVIIGIIIFGSLIFWFVNHARKGRELFIRRIAGLDAVEEAVGRATEMGKAILYVPGLSSVGDVATIASLNILGEVARKAAQYETTLLVPNRDPIVYTVAQAVVKEAYTKEGRPDAYRDENVFFITDSQFAYAAAVDGIMVREKPATNFFLGMFWAESLILAETGATTGAIQIAGTDSVYQLPFFITACDYTLIGEELYAASAYLSREPTLLASLKAQDYGKLIIIALIIFGSALLLVSVFPGLSFFKGIMNFFSVS